MTLPVIMDCDPGHDDAIALILAHSHPSIEIKGVGTTAGNQTIEKTTLNARKILEFAGSSVKVSRGASKPLFRELITAASVHGKTGLDGPELPDPVLEESEFSAFEMMVDVLENSRETVSIIPTGALTNVAMLLLARPDLKKKIKQISLMGGSAIGGNWSAAAEFNILVDPEAAEIVFNSGIPVIMSGLDVTYQAIIKDSDIERFRNIGTETSVMVAQLLDFFKKFHEEKFPHFGGSPLHDPCAVAVLASPELFVYREASVHVECRGRYTTGSTVVSFAGPPRNMADGSIVSESSIKSDSVYSILSQQVFESVSRKDTETEPDVKVLVGIDREGFVDLLAGALERLK